MSEPFYAVGLIVVIAFCIWIVSKDFNRMLRHWDERWKRGRRNGR